jgi:hypothetical protein
MSRRDGDFWSLPASHFRAYPLPPHFRQKTALFTLKLANLIIFIA